jgi:hypothetical protein
MGVGAVALLTACTAGAPSNTGVLALNSNAALDRSPLRRSGIASEFLGIALLPKAAFAPSGLIASHRGRKKKGKLFVDNYSPEAVLILKNKNWSQAGTITEGISSADGNWYDTHGLYVANSEAPNIEEYDAEGSLKFTYSAGMTNPITVATDADGNVYEADFAGEEVNEYRQASNTVAASCQPGGKVEGVAVDKSGDVFIAYYTGVPPYGTATISEYKGGLNGCSETTFAPRVSFPGGLILDDKNDLIICDQIGKAIYIIPPPYSSISGTLGTGYSEPFHVSLDKANGEAYVTDVGSETIDEVTYPAGARVATLGSSYGLGYPNGAVDSSNYVP